MQRASDIRTRCDLKALVLFVQLLWHEIQNPLLPTRRAPVSNNAFLGRVALNSCNSDEIFRFNTIENLQRKEMYQKFCHFCKAKNRVFVIFAKQILLILSLLQISPTETAAPFAASAAARNIPRCITSYTRVII